MLLKTSMSLHVNLDVDLRCSSTGRLLRKVVSAKMNNAEFIGILTFDKSWILKECIIVKIKGPKEGGRECIER